MSAQPGASCPFLLRQDWAGQVWVLAKGQSQGRTHRSGGSVTTHLTGPGDPSDLAPTPSHSTGVLDLCL